MADARHGSHDATDESTLDAADDFEFRIEPTGGLAPGGPGAAVDMCVADELFSDGKILLLRPSATAANALSYVPLPRCESAASTVGYGARSDSRSASSSGGSSGCVSRSHSSSSDHGAASARRSLSSSLFYAQPSPSPQLRSSSRPRRSIGSAPLHAAWGFMRLGVAGAPEVYPPRPAEANFKIAAAARGGSRSARFERAGSGAEKRHGLGLFGDGLGCKCSPDVVVEPVSSAEATKKGGAADGGAKKGRSGRRIRILDWLEELSMTKEKK